MPHRDDEETGSFSADIPEDAIAEALRAVERKPKGRVAETRAPSPIAKAANEPVDAGLTVEVEAPASPEDASRDELVAQVKRLEAQAAEEHGRLLRVAADADNARKRWLKEREEIQKYGIEKLARELLPALDALDRALATAAADDPLVKGVELTRRLFEDALGRFGVKGFSAQGGTFDARLHEALMTLATLDAPPGTILEEQQRGFMIHERLLRPATVVVAAAPRAEGARPLDPSQLDRTAGERPLTPAAGKEGDRASPEVDPRGGTATGPDPA